MEISCLRQAANAQLTLASSRCSLYRSCVLDSARGLPRLRATATVARLDSSKGGGCAGDGAGLRFKFGGGRLSRIREASALRRRAPGSGAWSAGLRAGNEVGNTVDASAGQGVFHTVHCLRPLSFLRPFKSRTGLVRMFCANCAPCELVNVTSVAIFGVVDFRKEYQISFELILIFRGRSSSINMLQDARGMSIVKTAGERNYSVDSYFGNVIPRG
jgi:hypothetical protein